MPTIPVKPQGSRSGPPNVWSPGLAVLAVGVIATGLPTAPVASAPLGNPAAELRHAPGSLSSLSLISSAQARQSPAANARSLREAREVIESQLKAFMADDAMRAYSFAAPGIRQRFESAERFMSMVREAYPAVYRPAQYRFLQAQVTRESLVQPVAIEDAEGRAWVAVYVLTRQPDSSWRIEGCQLSPEQGKRT